MLFGGFRVRMVLQRASFSEFVLLTLLPSVPSGAAQLQKLIHISNSTDLINQLLQTPLTPTTTFASLDITNMYSNVPLNETRKILGDITLNNMVDPDIRHELLSWFDTVTKQNYFLHNNNTITQKEGLAMGAPSSSILSEIFLQHIEHSHLPRLTKKHRLVNYFRYVDDILVIYDSSTTDIMSILNDFNSIHPNLTFTDELEQDNKLNFLDITIHKTPPGIKISVFRKPTFTDTLIPYTSNHPPQHKYSAIRFLYTRLNSYHLNPEEHRQEENIIRNILFNNSFPIPSHTPHAPRRHPPPPLPEKEHKWFTFTYTGKETRHITNLFKHANLRIAFRTNNTLHNHLTRNTHTRDKFTCSGVYRLTCPDCGKAYIGQNGRDFASRNNEQTQTVLPTQYPHVKIC
jgi:hypothetical protein